MGDPRKCRKQYSKPKKRWDKQRILSERKIIDFYGLKNKKEIRRTESILRKKRTIAKKLLAFEAEQRAIQQKQLLDSLRNIGIFKGDAGLDDVLSLTIQEILERRLQTIVWRKNLAATPKQARQFIVHGHIAVGDRKASCPSYLVKAIEEEKVRYFGEPMQIAAPKKETREALKKKFEELAKAEAGEEKAKVAAEAAKQKAAKGKDEPKEAAKGGEEK